MKFKNPKLNCPNIKLKQATRMPISNTFLFVRNSESNSFFYEFCSLKKHINKRNSISRIMLTLQKHTMRQVELQKVYAVTFAVLPVVGKFI